MTEIEVKIRVDNLNQIKKSILENGALLTKPRYLEKNTLYDYPAHSLYRKQQAIRIRCIEKKTFLTFKGRPQPSRKFKIREEYETEVKNRKHVEKILKSLGLIPVFQYQKYRTAFRKKHLIIFLDETEAGDFLELEGQRNDIVNFAKILGFSRPDFIKTDYIQLLKREKEKNKDKEKRKNKI